MQEEPIHKNSVSRMLFINSGLWMLLFLYSMKGTFVFAWIINFFCMIGIIAVTSFGIALVDSALLKKSANKYVKYLLSACPSLLVLLILMIFLPDLQLPGKSVNLLKSPSGQYDLSFPIEDSYRQLTISNRKGAIEYKGEKIDINNGNRLYWIWDSDNNVWVYDSGNQNVFVFTKKADKWEKAMWGVGTSRTGGLTLIPPKALYPVKEREKNSGTAVIIKPASDGSKPAAPPASLPTENE
jgi:energy-coupling factor transporter transmembrane protein EcfT